MNISTTSKNVAAQVFLFLFPSSFNQSDFGTITISQSCRCSQSLNLFLWIFISSARVHQNSLPFSSDLLLFSFIHLHHHQYLDCYTITAAPPSHRLLHSLLVHMAVKCYRSLTVSYSVPE